MEEKRSHGMTFWARIKMAFGIIFNGEFARQIYESFEPRTPEVIAPERLHASGLFLLSVFQREGRFIDFLQQEVSGFSDQDVGAAARVVHTGCRKMLHQYFNLAPALSESEGARYTVPEGFDNQRIRLTGNVSGKPPFKGTLKHHGWIVTELRLPALSESVDPKILAPAEVEL